MRRRRPAAAVLAGVVLVLAPAAVASSAGSVSPQDSFTGQITGGTGSWAGASGTVSIEILNLPSPSSTRVVTLVVHGKPCGTAAGCIRLHGRLTGTLTPIAPEPVADVGDAFKLKAHGVLKPLGHLRAHGSVHGTGYVATGHESMRLKLRGGDGSVSLRAHSATVPGFTNP